MLTKASRRFFSSPTRKFFVGGNWKCNGSLAQTQSLVESLNISNIPSSVEVVVAPAAIHTVAVKNQLRKDVKVSSQDTWIQGNGAFTGEVSADMLKDAGVSYSIIGHSERRQKGESNDEVAKKAGYALSKGLSVIACIGETKQERESNKTMQVVTDQLKAYSKLIKDWTNVVVAYEPVCNIFPLLVPIKLL